MTHPILRAAMHASVITALTAGATSAVFFSLPRQNAKPPILPVLMVESMVKPRPIEHALPPIALNAPSIAQVASIKIEPAKKISSAPSIAPIITAEPNEARLLIPIIGVDAVIKEMGYTSDGAMAVPANRTDVGWFEPGTIPGETGSAVIGGHNKWDNGLAVFIHLDRLVVGDIVTVVDTQGAVTTFMVRGMRTFDATDTDSGIFESLSGSHLNLITCSGVWNASTKDYSTRLVVFTEAV